MSNFSEKRPRSKYLFHWLSKKQFMVQKNVHTELKICLVTVSKSETHAIFNLTLCGFYPLQQVITKFNCKPNFR